MLRVACVGYDHVHLPRYAPAIAAHPRAELAAIVATGANRALARRHAEAFGAAYLERLDELWWKAPVEAAYVGTPPDEHLGVVRALAERGVHILCDKPLATTLEDADAIIDVARRHGVKLMVPFNPRFQQPVVRLKRMLEARELGRLHQVHATKYGKVPRNVPEMDTAWFFDRRRAGFGGFGDIGIHAVDAVRWLAGSEAKRVYARIDRALHDDLEVDDMGTALVEFRNGVLASLQCGWVNPPGHATWLSVSFEVLGSEGAATVDKPYHDLELSDGTRTERIAWWRTDVADAVDEFVRAVEEDRRPAITGEDARAALELTIACYRSAETGAPVALPL